MSKKDTFRLGRKTFEKILEIVEGKDADVFVDHLLKTGEATFLPVGNRGENAGQIMIGADHIKAITEVIGSNTADALAASYVAESGENPSSPRDVVERRLGFDKGRFETLDVRDKVIQRALNDVEVSLRGHIPKGLQPKDATIDVRDHGIGVQADEVAHTLCGLGGGLKTFETWPSGKFGQGGKAPLAHANREGSVCQLIVTRHKDSEVVSFTFIVRDQRKGIARTPIWNYLVDPNTGQPWQIRVGKDCDFEVGTLIRTFDYPLGVKGSGPFGKTEGSLDSLIRRTLPDPLNPITFVDRRTSDKSNRSWVRYLKGKRSSFNHLGSLHKLYHDPNVRLYRQYELDFGVGSKAQMHVFVFDHDTPAEYLNRYASCDHPFLISLNGQTHGELSKHILTRDVGYTALNRRFYALIDVDNTSLAMQNNLFASTRESATKSPELTTLKSRVVKALMSDPDLQDLNLEYRDSNSSRVNSSEDQIVRNLLNQYIESRKTSHPHGTQKRSTPREGTKTSPRLPIPVNDPPTMFKLLGSVTRDVCKGKTFRICVDTDAHPDLFDDLGETFMVSAPYSYLTYESCTRNDGGHKSFTFSVSPRAPSDVTGTISLILDPPNGTPMEVTVEVNVKDPEPEPPRDEGLPFEVQNVDTSEFLEALEMIREDVSVLKEENGEKVIYINLLNPLFQDQIENFNDDGRFKDPSEIVMRFRALYRGEAILTAWEVFEDNAGNEEDIDLMERLIRRGSRCAFNTLRRTVKTAGDLRKLTGNMPS